MKYRAHPYTYTCRARAVAANLFSRAHALRSRHSVRIVMVLRRLSIHGLEIYAAPEVFEARLLCRLRKLGWRPTLAEPTIKRILGG